MLFTVSDSADADAINDFVDEIASIRRKIRTWIKKTALITVRFILTSVLTIPLNW